MSIWLQRITLTYNKIGNLIQKYVKRFMTIHLNYGIQVGKQFSKLLSQNVQEAKGCKGYEELVEIIERK